MKQCVVKVYIAIDVPTTKAEQVEFLMKGGPTWTAEELRDLVAGERYERIATLALLRSVGHHSHLSKLAWATADGYKCPQDGTEDVGPLLVGSHLQEKARFTSAKDIIDAYDTELMKRMLQN